MQGDILGSKLQGRGHLSGSFRWFVLVIFFDWNKCVCSGFGTSRDHVFSQGCTEYTCISRVLVTKRQLHLLITFANVHGQGTAIGQQGRAAAALQLHMYKTCSHTFPLFCTITVSIFW